MSILNGVYIELRKWALLCLLVFFTFCLISQKMGSENFNRNFKWSIASCLFCFWLLKTRLSWRQSLNLVIKRYQKNTKLKRFLSQNPNDGILGFKISPPTLRSQKPKKKFFNFNDLIISFDINIKWFDGRGMIEIYFTWDR